MKRKKIEVSEDQEEEDCGVKKIKAEDSSKSQNSQSFVKNFRLKLKKGDFHDGNLMKFSGFGEVSI